MRNNLLIMASLGCFVNLMHAGPPVQRHEVACPTRCMLLMSRHHPQPPLPPPHQQLSAGIAIHVTQREC